MDQEEIRQRLDNIFELIVRSYIETAEPVGSRTISKHSELNLSAASVRNVMADLEEMGLITQPHTSAGRVPTDKGYRYYVDRLMRQQALSDKEKDWIVKELSKARTVENLAERVSKVISELTENAAIMYIRNLKRVSFLNYLLEELMETEKLSEFLEEDAGLFIEGAFRMFEQPEFSDAATMRRLLHAFDEKYHFLNILAKDLAAEGIHVHIGTENPKGDLENVSLVVKDCYVNGQAVGGVAAVGPTRMNYPKAVAVVDFVADNVSRAIKGL